MKVEVNLDNPPISIAIPLKFNGPQPNHFGAGAATTRPMKSGNFIGDTRQGGSCNADEITLNPHCNGTHTESISHVVDELIAPHEVVKQPLMPAYLLTVSPQQMSNLDNNKDTYLPPLNPEDMVLSKEVFTAVRENIHKNVKALIIRTLPNQETKLKQIYGASHQPPFFSNQAMHWLVKHTEIQHLLVDMPSVDRLYDDGVLSNHRIFWNIEPGSHQRSKKQYHHKTITEMIYVPDNIKDGRYLLSLQIPRLSLNAVPSNPLLYQLKG